VRAYGSAIFFVGNDHSGTIELRYSVIRHNTGGGWNVLPDISMHDDTKRLLARIRAVPHSPPALVNPPGVGRNRQVVVDTYSEIRG
jgi:hypothetical protein